MTVKSKTFHVEGMSCASCVKRVEEALGAQKGVQSVKVNLATETVEIYFDPGVLQNEDQVFASGLSQIGYRLRMKESKQKKDFLSSWWEVHGDLSILSASAFLTLPLVLPMFFMFAGWSVSLSPFLQFLLAFPVQFIFGARFYINGFRALKNGSPNMDVLVVIGTSAAFGLSVYEGFWGSQSAEHLYFESSAVIITLVLLGKYLERRAKRKTTEALQALSSLMPEVARVLRNGEEVLLPVFKVLKGDTVIIRPGDRIPVDGIIRVGATTVDESMLSGESMPISKKEEDFVYSGSLNLEGLITIEAKKVESESMLAQIVRMLESAGATKSPIEKLVDRVSEVFVPTVLLMALITLLAWIVLGESLDRALINAVSVLVIACPCALGLATPTALMVGRGLAAKHGILIKDLDAMEEAFKIKAIIFDKTGTLTEGQPQWVETILSPVSETFKTPVTESILLEMAYGLQKLNTHPFAKAIIQQALLLAVDGRDEFQNIRVVSGKGVEGQRIKTGDQIQIGSQRWLIEQGYDVEPFREAYTETLEKGYSTAWVANHTTKEVYGYHSFTDAIKRDAMDSIRRLKSMGLHTVLLSGDKKEVAERVGALLQMDSVEGEVQPSEKLSHLIELKERWGAVAMVGDGINDAPALAAANLGIAMGNGTDVAIGAAAMTLMKSQPTQVVEALLIAQTTYLKIRQNLFWAFIYNTVGIPLAALGWLNPMIAAGAMAFSSVSVIGNSLRLNRTKILKG